MAISAYDSGGRLKKHALLGTSLASDPGRVKQRKQFEALHEEAKSSAGEGREAMVSKLSSRFKTFGDPQQERLAELASKQQAFDEEYGELAAKKAARSGLYKDWEAEKSGYPGNVMPGVAKILKTINLPKEHLQVAKKEWEGMSPGDKKSWFKERGVKWAPGIPRKFMIDFANKSFAEQYGPSGDREYNRKFQGEVDRINRSYIPIQEETAERQQRLADRAELYNMFLGE